MFHDYSVYFIMMLISVIVYIVYKLIKKEFLKNKLNDFKNIIVILTLTSYIYAILFYNGEFIYDMNYIKCVLIFLSISMIIFIYGIIKNKQDIYQKNIGAYIILYLILLISLTMFIKRAWHFDFNNLTKFDSPYVRLQPFYSINNFLRSDVSISTKFYQLFGNLIAFIPLSFLLMVKDNKYKNIFKQLKIILVMIICIEFLQLVTGTGTLDIDDVILNSSGVIIFTFLITRFSIIDYIKKIFYFDLKLNKKIAYFGFMLSIIIPIIFIIDTFLITIERLI